MTSSRLDVILETKRDEVSRLSRARTFSSLEDEARSADSCRGFEMRLRSSAESFGHGLIAESKRASPSKGVIVESYDSACAARSYESGGASCVSVLTDSVYFMGSSDDLREARSATSLPILRKDFMLSPLQIAESRAMGSDCVLLIMAALSDSQAEELESASFEFGMDVLLEVHDEFESERAMGLRSSLFGVNNRDLRTFETDLSTSERLSSVLSEREDSFLVSESGISSRSDVERLRSSGYRGFLVGESLMRSDDVVSATRELSEA